MHTSSRKVLTKQTPPARSHSRSFFIFIYLFIYIYCCYSGALQSLAAKEKEHDLKVVETEVLKARIAELAGNAPPQRVSPTLPDRNTPDSTLATALPGNDAFAGVARQARPVSPTLPATRDASAAASTTPMSDAVGAGGGGGGDGGEALLRNKLMARSEWRKWRRTGGGGACFLRGSQVFCLFVFLGKVLAFRRGGGAECF